MTLLSGLWDHCGPKTLAVDRRLHDVRWHLSASEPHRDGWWQLPNSADVFWVVSTVFEKCCAQHSYRQAQFSFGLYHDRPASALWYLSLPAPTPTGSQLIAMIALQFSHPLKNVVKLLLNKSINTIYFGNKIVGKSSQGKYFNWCCNWKIEISK